MKNKPWLKYLIYLLLILGLIYIDGYLKVQENIYQEETYGLNYIYFVISIFTKISIGSLLGLEYLVDEMQKEGSWKINLPKMLFLVLPSLYFSISYFAFYFFIENPFYQVITYPIFIFIKNDLDFVYIFQLMLGYFLITSFFKESKDLGKTIN